MRASQLALLPMLGLLTGCIVDGITTPTDRGLAADSRRVHLGDLRPDEIETIEVLKGPAAAQLYGTHPCAAMLVTTKHRTLAD